jgi:hypothetical protein
MGKGSWNAWKYLFMTLGKPNTLMNQYGWNSELPDQFKGSLPYQILKRHLNSLDLDKISQADDLPGGHDLYTGRSFSAYYSCF